MTLRITRDDLQSAMDLSRRLFTDPVSGLEKHWRDDGMYRPGYSDKETEAISFIAHEARQMGMETVQDAAGNVYMVYAGKDRTKPVSLAGSHVDAVPQGGRYDGPAGVVATLAAIKAMHDKGITPETDVGVVIWRNEESPWFEQWGMGSGLVFGSLKAAILDNRQREDGETLRTHMTQQGANVSFVEEKLKAGEAIIPEQNIGVVGESHIKQDRELRDAGVSIGIGVGIRGNVRFPKEARISFSDVEAVPGNAIEAGLELVSKTEAQFEAMRSEGDIVYSYPIAAPREAREDAGQNKNEIRFIGEASHSGSTLQDDRKDSVRAGALFRQKIIEKLQPYIDDSLIELTFVSASTGKNASPTTVPAEFSLGIHIALADDKLRGDIAKIIEQQVYEAASERGCDADIPLGLWDRIIRPSGEALPAIQNSFRIQPEVRSVEQSVLTKAEAIIVAAVDSYTHKSDVAVAFNPADISVSKPARMSESMIEKLEEFAAEAGIKTKRVVSGAGHDVMRPSHAKHASIDTYLIFMDHGWPNNGISHNPAEMLAREEGDDPYDLQGPFADAVLLKANMMLLPGKEARAGGQTFSQAMIDSYAGKPFVPKLQAA